MLKAPRDVEILRRDMQISLRDVFIARGDIKPTPTSCFEDG